MTRMYFFQKWILVILLAGTALALDPFLVLGDTFQFPKVAVLIAGIALLSVLNLIHFFSQKEGGVVFNKIPFEWVCFGVLFLAQVIAFVFSVDRQASLMGQHVRFEGFLTTIHYLLLCVNVFYFFRTYPFEKTQSVFRALLVVLGISCFFALSAYVLPETFPFYLFNAEFSEGRVYGTLGNANYLAGFLIGVLPLLVFYLRKIYVKLPFNKVVFFASALLLIVVIVTLFLTGSRSAWIASLIGFFLYGLLEAIKLRQYRFLIGVMTVVILLAGAFFFKNSLTSIIPQAERLRLDTVESTSLQTRVHLWKAGVQMFFHRPWTGFGQEQIQGNIEPFLPEYLQANDVFFIDRTHSEFIDIFAMEGVFAGFAYIVFFGCILWKSSRFYMSRIVRNRDLSEANFDWAFIPVVIGCFTLIVFHAVNFGIISTNVLLYFFAGYLLSLIF